MDDRQFPTSPVQTRMIWNQAPHNAFTSLVRLQDKWFCAFREGEHHVSYDGKVRVLVSEDGENWFSAALISTPRTDLPDLRDAKLTITHDQQLMLTYAAANRNEKNETLGLQTFVSFSKNGTDWSTPKPIGTPNHWLWCVTWHGPDVYAIGYTCRYQGKSEKSIYLYRGRKGDDFEQVGKILADPQWPTEADLFFYPDDSAVIVVRRELTAATPPVFQGHAAVGWSKPPYTQWTWADAGIHIGAPDIVQLEDGRLVVGGRMFENGHAYMGLGLLDTEKNTITPFYKLPSGGDCSYSGMVFYNGEIWVSYYSSHEGKSSIYLTRVSTELFKK